MKDYLDANMYCLIFLTLFCCYLCDVPVNVFYADYVSFLALFTFLWNHVLNELEFPKPKGELFFCLLKKVYWFSINYIYRQNINSIFLLSKV